jgi:hypothetical protein
MPEPMGAVSANAEADKQRTATSVDSLRNERISLLLLEGGELDSEPSIGCRVGLESIRK